MTEKQQEKQRATVVEPKQQENVTPVEQEHTPSEAQNESANQDDKPNTTSSLSNENVNASFSDAAGCSHEWNLDSGSILNTTTPGEGLDGLESTSRGAEYTCVNCGSRLILSENQTEDNPVA